MSTTKKITTNVNKDVGLLDLPRVKVPTTKWISKHTNYVSMDLGDIYPIYVSEVVPKERRRVTMAMLSHMTTPQAPLLNAMYTEIRAFFVPHRLSSDLLAGFNTRKSPYVKVFGEDDSKTGARVVVPLNEQKLPDVSIMFANACAQKVFKPFGGLFDALDYEPDPGVTSIADKETWYKHLNFLSMAAYELIYQHCYRNQNRESPTESRLYQFLYNAYNRTSNINSYDDSFHKANREKDYYTGAQPFTQKGDPVSVGLVGDAEVNAKVSSVASGELDTGLTVVNEGNKSIINSTEPASSEGVTSLKLTADLSSASGVNIEQLRLMIKTQEMLEKDMMYGSDYASSLNAHFGVNILKALLDEPQEIKKTIVTSQMQAVLQTSSTSSEPSILGSIGANATTQSGDLDIVPETFFPEYGYLIICAVHKTQNVYDSKYFKPKHIFKKARFDFFTPELEDLGYQKVDGREMKYSANGINAIGFNESYAEYRFTANKCHGMVEPSRSNSLDFWTTAISDYNDLQSLYKQGNVELDRVIASTSAVVPQFFDAYGFIEINDKPMKLHSIPGMDGVI